MYISWVPARPLVWLPAANLERRQAWRGLGVGNFYVVDARGTRAFAQSRMQAGQLFARALCQHLDGAVGIVADPAGDPEDVSLALYEPAKTYALDAAADEKTASESRRLVFCGSHRLIAEVRGQIAEVKSIEDCRGQIAEVKSHEFGG
jgi:hypothetical protein